MTRTSLHQGGTVHFVTMTASTVALVLCLENSGDEAALERRKLYGLLPDAEAETRGLLPVIDESGEDYLYPAGMF